MNTEVIDRLVEKDPSLESSRPVLESMNPGTYCIHRSWGFGVISGFDDDRGMILIDFEDDERTSHAMDPVFCIDKLDLLSENHILAQHRKNTEEIEKIAKKEPAELIIKILEQGNDGCMNTRDIERILGYMFGAAKANVGGQQPRRYSSRIRVLQFQIRRMNPMYLGMNRLSLNRKSCRTSLRKNDLMKKLY